MARAFLRHRGESFEDNILTLIRKLFTVQFFSENRLVFKVFTERDAKLNPKLASSQPDLATNHSMNCQ